jgi:hypothetical protein
LNLLLNAPFDILDAEDPGQNFPVACKNRNLVDAVFFSTVPLFFLIRLATVPYKVFGHHNKPLPP